MLPVMALLRRADLAVVIGAALAAKAAGAGYRPIAVMLGRPPETVRGWLRCFAGRVEAVRGVFTGWLRALAADRCCPSRPPRRGRTRSWRSSPPLRRWPTGSVSAW